jgi:putative transposase
MTTMHSYSEIYIHIVFATKYRERILRDEERDQVHRIMTEAASANGLTVIEINSVADHIHVLGRMHPTCMLSHAVRDMKANTSRWINCYVPEVRPFRWQNGYYARSVDPSGVRIVRAYIRRQQEHHRR